MQLDEVNQKVNALEKRYTNSRLEKE